MPQENKYSKTLNFITESQLKLHLLSVALFLFSTSNVIANLTN